MVRHTYVIKKIMVETGIRQKDLVERLGLKTQSRISERIRSPGLGLKLFLEILDCLGYEILVRPKSTEAPPDGEYVIKHSDYV